MTINDIARETQPVLVAALGVLVWSCVTPPHHAIASTAVAEPTREVAPRSDYAEVAAALTALIEHEMADKELPAVSIALVDDQQTVWAQGFGRADPDEGIAATADTVYRVGSVSKLFTDLGIMQLVERGQLDLDAPVSSYLPEFAPHNPYDAPITLRQLMSHRSGLVREPPVGSYFDDSGGSLESLLESLNDTTLVAEPGTRVKYSNAGVAVVGAVLQEIAEVPFAEALQESLLRPIEMTRSGFVPTPAIRRDLAAAFMWTYDGRRWPAPTFELRMTPAGSMYSTVTDLGRFLSVLFAGGAAPGGQVISPVTLEKMWTPQFGAEGAGGSGRNYGIGFGLAELDGARWVGHGGAIYGFATQLGALPDDKLGVVVTTTVDAVNRVTARIAATALRMMRAARAGEPLPESNPTELVPQQQMRELAGTYTAEADTDGAITLERLGDGLYLRRHEGGFRQRLRLDDEGLVTDGRLGFGTRVVPVDGGIQVDGAIFERLPDRRPEAPPERWRGLIGEYGWDHNTLYILEDASRLHALIEWFFQYPLEEVGDDVYAFPDTGLYPLESLTFERGADGRAERVMLGGIEFPRRDVGDDGETFRIVPQRPVAELRATAMSTEPPAEEGDFRPSDLVELRHLDPTIRYDIRYATHNNFMGAVFYEKPHAFLQRPAAEAVVRAHRQLQEHGFGLLIHDAYRPWFVTKMFFDATPAEQRIFVANPSQGSRHNRGAAVDLTLYDLATGEPVPMVSGYDEFSPRAFPDYPGGASLARWHRRLLREVMDAEGFDVYEWEWWHYDYGDWREYAIGNRSFDEVLAD